MSALPASKPSSAIVRFRTVADLQAHLGGIPAHRIRLNPPPGHATEADVLAVHAKENIPCELIDGILVEKAMASYQSRLACVLIYFIEMFLEDNDLGVVLGESGMLRLFPKQVRAPDVSFISWKRMPNHECPYDPIWALSPNLAVEILSESNTKKEIERKLQEYFDSGTKLAWIVDPETRTVKVYTTATKFTLLAENDSLDGKKVLPGFSLSIKKWFERASRKPRK